MDTGMVRPGAERSYWVAGDLYTFLATGEDTGGAYALIEALVPPQGGPPPHLHRREDEAFYVLDGELAFQADGRAFTATAGTWITLPRGSLHSFKNVGAAAAKMLIVVSPSGLEKFFAEVGREATDRSEAAGAMTAADLEKLLRLAPKYGLEIRLPPQ